MDSKKEFEKFIDNLSIKNGNDINVSYKGVTKKCNQTFYENDSEVLNSLQVGSYGRVTAIHGVSDLDMLFEMPNSYYNRFNDYEGNGQYALLETVKDTLKLKYPDSDIKVDGQVVVFNHTNYRIELLPAFLLGDGSYRFADTSDGGSWKITKPIEEIAEVESFDAKSGVLRRLCKMVRSWKNRNGVPMGGLLIDTLCYNFLKENPSYHNVGYEEFGKMSKAFFEYLSITNQAQLYWLAPGSNQQVYKKADFVPKAKKAKANCEKAIENEGKEGARKFWKRIFGRQFPVKEVLEKSLSESTFRDTEEYIEDKFPIDISESLVIECRVTQDGFRTQFLSSLSFLKSKYSLEFFISSTSATLPYDIYWKVKNIGPEAEKRDQIRGQIVSDEGNRNRKESSNFKGEHYVECYIAKNGRVVARDFIPVNIEDF